MVRPLRFARNLAPKLVVGGLYAAVTASSFAGGGAPIPPCSPDGTCLPRYETWGWYETRWRPFPGDAIAGKPTEAERDAPDEGDQQQLRGPILPDAGEETQIGPERPTGANRRPAAPATTPAEGAGPAIPGTPEGTGVAPVPAGEAVPGVLPGEGGVLPPGGMLPQPGEGTVPEASPETIDPFGAAPPSPPSWMVEQTSFEPLNEATGPAGFTLLPAAQPANLKADDAPPELPAGLQAMLGRTGGQPAWSPTGSRTVALAQPIQVRPVRSNSMDRGVVQTSAEAPLGIQLINPASAIAPVADESGLQQAIYFEASDQPSFGSPTLPPVAPGN